MVPDLAESAPSATTMTLLEKWSGGEYFISILLVKYLPHLVEGVLEIRLAVFQISSRPNSVYLN